MDSKITKKRVSNFFSYEWILIIIVAVVSIFIAELLYALTGVGLTVGQSYRLYFDQTISLNGSVFENSLKYGLKDGVFSFDVLEMNVESLSSKYNTFTARMSTNDGDAIFTDSVPSKKDMENGKEWEVRANVIIDGYNVCDMETLLTNAKNYLINNYLKGETVSKENIDDAKLKSYFLNRMKGDNRFRTDSEKLKGIKEEKKRIEKLVEDVLFLEKAFDYGKDKGWFYSYKKYTYMIDSASKQEDKEIWEQLADKEEHYYGVNVNNLKNGGKEDRKTVEDYFCRLETQNAENVVLLVFGLFKEQPDLEYESISLINHVIKTFSGINEIREFE